ncbi:MAG: rhodanese-like domain-containing protein [Actinobacteria bacterium]|nr:rhodanese-like domain-containing protein [Actinomycetota bacterium]
MPSIITHDELVVRLADGTIVLLDAQAPGWFEREHLPGAHRIDWDDVEHSVGTAVPDRATPVAVYCWNATCTGSEIAAAELEHLGYRNVYRYVGGKQDWTDHGAPLTTPGAS